MERVGAGRVQCGACGYNVVHCGCIVGIMQCIRVTFGTLWYNIVHCGYYVVQVQCGTVWYNLVHCGCIVGTMPQPWNPDK